MSTTTAATLIAAALRKISSYTPGQGVDGRELSPAMDELNRMLAAWSVDGLMIPYRTLESFTMVVGQASYTIGSGANFSTTRPTIIRSAFIRDSNNLDYYITTDLTREEYDEIPLKTVQGITTNIYYDTQFPNGVIYVYPTAQLAYTLFLDSEKYFLSIASSGTTVNLPDEYQDTIVWNLGKRLAPEYGFDLASPAGIIVATEADKSLARIKLHNSKIAVSKFDAALSVNSNGDVRGSDWNIYNG